ncbi:MAG: hypothetical protein KatS3mg043_0153 [Rhodothermaceae bacterium]|nr:MAG: hypothetical protein KatS3mg043_0153 [Rhodothermaceae bacterium]
MAAELAVPDRREVAFLVRGLCDRLHARLTQTVEERRRHIRHLIGSRAFLRPVDRLHTAGQRLDELLLRLSRSPRRLFETRRHRLDALTARLHLLDPRRPLHLGYARVERGGVPVTRRCRPPPRRRGAAPLRRRQPPRPDPVTARAPSGDPSHFS